MCAWLILRLCVRGRLIRASGKRKVPAALDREFEAGRISDAVYRTFLEGRQRRGASDRSDENSARAVREPGRGSGGRESQRDHPDGRGQLESAASGAGIPRSHPPGPVNDLTEARFGDDGDVVVGASYFKHTWSLVEAEELKPTVENMRARYATGRAPRACSR